MTPTRLKEIKDFYEKADNTDLTFYNGGIFIPYVGSNLLNAVTELIEALEKTNSQNEILRRGLESMKKSGCMECGYHAEAERILDSADKVSEANEVGK